MPRLPGTHVDHYELLVHLADGAQAEVHRAKDTRTGAEVVIKFPHARVLDNPVFAGRWRREANITEALMHPNVQCRHGVGERHHEPYVVVEYAAGGSLEKWLNPVGPRPSIDQVLQWGRQLAQALAYLRDMGIIHRDLKPANILITDDLDLKLGDFGAATTTSPRHRWWHLPSPPEGTAEYLSPEQVIGQPGDERSDIYGWGVVMYELLTGHVPHTGPTPLDAMAAHLTGIPAPIHDQRDDVPPSLEAVVLQALRRQPKHRYPNALALLDDLDHLDQLDPTRFDQSPEPATRGVVGGAEGPVLIRIVLATAGGFLAFVAVVMLLTSVLR